MSVSRWFALLLVVVCTVVLFGCRGTYLGRLATLHGPDVEDYRQLPSRAVDHRPSTPLPARLQPDWVSRTPFSIGDSRISSAAQLDRILEDNGTTAFIVLADGEVIDERYFHGYRRDSLFKSFSMSKSVLSALIGMAEADGLLSSSDRVSDHLDTSENPQLGELTLEQLLDNVSGLAYARGNAPWKQQPRMYYTTDVRRYVLGAQVAHAPGSRFDGEDLSPLLLGAVLESAIRKRKPDATLSGFAAERLWQPMGAEFPALWVIDREREGLEKTESGFTARAIDLARFGQLYLDQGRANGVSIVPAGWVQASVAAPPAGAPNLFREGYYQNLWWGYFRPGRRHYDFYANGHFGQRLYVSPDKRLVVLRLGKEGGAVDWTAALAAIADAWPAPSDSAAGGLEPSSDQWLQDIDVLQRSFQALHPGLYRYNAEAEILAGFDALRRTASEGADFRRMYLALSEFAASIRCGHTYTNFGNQEDSTKARLYLHRARLPFQFRWLDGRMIVTQNFSPRPELAAGTEVLSINGVASAQILDRLLRIARADGHNDAKRINYLELQGREEFDAFDVYLPLYFEQIGERLDLQVRVSGAQDVRRLVVYGQGYDDRQRQRRSSMPRGAEAPEWRLSHPAPDRALLEMSTWALYGTSWDWRAYIDKMFVDLAAAGTRRLIIDLRNNEGGLTEIGDRLLAHLIDQPLALPALEKRVSYRVVPSDLSAHLSTWDPSFKNWGDQAVPLETGVFRLQRPGDDGKQVVLRPLAPRFTGEVVVLTSATNSSAAFEFIQRVRHANAAWLIGSPTGGNQRGINGGAFFFLTLPNSRIEFDLPLIGQFPLAPMPDAGLTPDRIIVATPEDIAAARDPALEIALNDHLESHR